MTVKYRPLHEQGMGRMINALFGGSMSQFLPLLQRKLASVTVEGERDILLFTFADGVVKYRADGDCCSHSWIEHIEIPDDIDGAEVQGITEYPVVDATDDDAKNPRRAKKYDWEDEASREHECLQLYQTVFHTTKGDISVEYRNSSNGYYGGSLELEPMPCPKCGEHMSPYSNAHVKCYQPSPAPDGEGRKSKDGK